SRIVHDTGAAVVDVLRAWAVGWRLGGGDALAAAITASAAAVDVESACRLALEASAERVTKWVLANTDAERPAAGMVADLGPAVAAIRGRLPDWVTGAEAETFHKRVSELTIAGLPPEPAPRHASRWRRSRWWCGRSGGWPRREETDGGRAGAVRVAARLHPGRRGDGLGPPVGCRRRIPARHRAGPGPGAAAARHGAAARS